MDEGIRVELYLRRLIENGDANKAYGHASVFLHMLGKEKCKELADFLKECIEPSTEED